MNKVITINLSGRLITIDEQAYQQLLSYLGWLSQFFSKEEGGQEIYIDIEDRIAELFEEKLKKNQASINEEDVQSIIMIMGSPEQIAMEHTDTFYDEKTKNLNEDASPKNEFKSNNNTRPDWHQEGLTRNSKDKVFGGVCSGLANHFKLDTRLVRVLMLLGFFVYGATFFLYIILWIFLPAKNLQANTSLNKKWYRSSVGKIVGGVCAGLAYPLNIKVHWLRLIFMFPLIGIIFFAIINEHDLMEFCIAAFPTLTVTYILLWIALPMANTLTQKMELKGEPLNVQGINFALREQNIQEESQTVRSENPLVIIFRIFAYIVLGFVLLIVGVVLVSLIFALIAILFGFTAVGFSLLSFSDLIFSSPSEAYVLLGSLLVLLIIPLMTIIRWLRNRINKQPGNKKSYYSFSVFFIAALFCTIYILSGLKNTFNSKFQSITPMTLVQPKDTLNLEFTNNQMGFLDTMEDRFQLTRNPDGSFDLPLVSLDVQPSENDSFYLELNRMSYGKDMIQAKSFAENTVYTYQTDSNSLILPKFVNLKKGTLFRGQLNTAVLFVPKGRVFRMKNIPPTYSKIWKFLYGPGWLVSVNFKDWDTDTLYKMTDQGTIERVDQSVEIQ
ncbi:MAG TPA: PspC domain-containing protein [Edaphocola sp.]|nr:PspC domain-containing protein [Edaphocola sp.]